MLHRTWQANVILTLLAQLTSAIYETETNFFNTGRSTRTERSTTSCWTFNENPSYSAQGHTCRTSNSPRIYLYLQRTTVKGSQVSHSSEERVQKVSCYTGLHLLCRIIYTTRAGNTLALRRKWPSLISVQYLGTAWNWGGPRENPARISGFQAEIRSRDFMNASQKRYACMERGCFVTLLRISTRYTYEIRGG